MKGGNRDNNDKFMRKVEKTYTTINPYIGITNLLNGAESFSRS
jgi:hypothetical protein